MKKYLAVSVLVKPLEADEEPVFFKLDPTMSTPITQGPQKLGKLCKRQNSGLITDSENDETSPSSPNSSVFDEHIRYQEKREFFKKLWGVPFVFAMEHPACTIYEGETEKGHCREVVIFASGSISVVDTYLGLSRVKMASLDEYIALLEK